jgi:glycosyltransferase involved in cell wall biosynthesis
MRIVHLIAPAAAGGAESAVRSLAIGQSNLGHQVEVATLTSRTTGTHPFVERLQQDGIRVSDIQTDRLDYLAESRAVTALLAKRKADVLHTHVYHADTVGYVAASQLGVPQVATMHGFTGGGIRLAAYTKLDMWVLRRCAAVIAVSPNVRDCALSEDITPERVHLVPNGYSPSPVTQLDRRAAREALELSPKAPVIGWIGRLSEEKGADLAIQAFANVQRKSAELCMVGDGPERINLELLARHARPAGRVHFAGRVNDAARYLQAFDALVLSSRTEGTPMVLLEAMAARIPIVTFAVGGVPAMLNPDSALMVAPGDVGGLSRALSFAIACPAAGTQRAVVARRMFDAEYTVSTSAWRTVRVYNSIIRAQSEPKAVPATAPARRSPRLQPAASMYTPAGT